jgi:trehalose 6-phosphate synthase
MTVSQKNASQANSGQNGHTTQETPQPEVSTAASADSPQQPLIVIASNRGPFSFTQNENGTFSSKRGAGGLVTALSALAQRYDVLWVAAALGEGDRAWSAEHHHQPQVVDETLIQLIDIEPTRYDQYYNVIANPLLWFIHHELWDAPRQPTITREIWQAWENYVEVNRQFAETVAAVVKDDLAKNDRPVFIFPQDYQLHLMSYYLRQLLGENVYIQPFMHIPWPGPDAWRILPDEMRTMLVSSLLESDRVGFQTQKDAFNFVQTARFYVSDAHSHGSRNSITYKGRRVEAKAYPISIDVEKVRELAAERETTLLKIQLLNYLSDSQVVLRVDRIEPSKNILRSLKAYRAMLEEYPEHMGKVRMLNLLVPSRMEVTEYQSYLAEIMTEVGMINAEFSDGFWEPVRVLVGGNYARALAGMQLYDVLVVNPIADGMNLVAKEGVLVNQRNGVLLLSEYAGAFYELGEHALIVSPFDVYSTAKAMHRALVMPMEERQRRAEALRRIVETSDVNVWFDLQLDDALNWFSSHSKKDSTSEMLLANTSAASSTTEGVSSDNTPTPTA